MAARTAESVYENWIHDLHENEPKSISYTIDGKSIPVTLFLWSCHPYRREELRLHFAPQQESGCYLLSTEDLTQDADCNTQLSHYLVHTDLVKFSELLHGCHFAHIKSICENGLQCAGINDNSPFRYKRDHPEWTALDPVKNNGNLSVVWFGANTENKVNLKSRYGNLVLRKQLSDYTSKACNQCYNNDLSMLGIADKEHDGWHFFFCELYQMKNEVESRFFVSEENQLPHSHAYLYYPGKPGGTWHLIDKVSGLSSTKLSLPSLELNWSGPSPLSFQFVSPRSLNHSIAFMIDAAPALMTLHLSLASIHNEAIKSPKTNATLFKNCLKKAYEYGYGQYCPDERLGINGPRTEEAKSKFRHLCKRKAELFKAVDLVQRR